MTSKIDSTALYTGDLSPKDVVLNYFPDSCYEENRKGLAQGFLEKCFRHLTNKEDRRTLEQAMNLFAYKHPAQVIITPGGYLRGGNIRLVLSDEEREKYRILDEMHVICTDHNKPHPDFRKLFGRKTLEEISRIRGTFESSLRECIGKIYEHGQLETSEIVFYPTSDSVVAVLLDRKLEDIGMEDTSAISSDYKRLLKRLEVRF